MQHARGTKSCGIKLWLRRTDGSRQFPHPSAGRLKAAGRAEAAVAVAVAPADDAVRRKRRGKVIRAILFLEREKGKSEGEAVAGAPVAKSPSVARVGRE